MTPPSYPWLVRAKPGNRSLVYGVRAPRNPTRPPVDRAAPGVALTRGTSTITTAADPAFAVEWVAVARNRKGQAGGGIRHQFRDEPNRFRTRLTAEFPARTPSHLVGAHAWHLACEFSNWLEAANSA